MSRVRTDPPRRGGGGEQVCGDSVKHIALIEFDAMSAEQSQQLGLEVLSLVMLVLTGDVFLDGLLLRLADGEDAVSLLPRKRGIRDERSRILLQCSMPSIKWKFGFCFGSDRMV